MKCLVCSRDVKDAEHIAIDDYGDPHVMCEICYEKVRIFFEEVNHRGKADS